MDFREKVDGRGQNGEDGNRIFFVFPTFLASSLEIFPIKDSVELMAFSLLASFGVSLGNFANIVEVFVPNEDLPRGTVLDLDPK